MVQQAVLALPAGIYTLVDPESDLYSESLDQELIGYPSAQVAQWSGSLPGSWGYGDLRLLQTPAGPGLAISLGGCQMQSASTLYVLPVGVPA